MSKLTSNLEKIKSIIKKYNEKFDQWPPQEYIAKKAGVSRATVSRRLRDLKQSGYVELKNSKITGLREIPSAEWLCRPIVGFSGVSK